jgi:hypothetical protein
MLAERLLTLSATRDGISRRSFDPLSRDAPSMGVDVR